MQINYKLFLYLSFVINSLNCYSKDLITLVLDPLNDSLGHNKIVHNDFEKSVAQKISEYIKKKLESEKNDIYVVILKKFSHHNNQERISFINQLNAQLYLTFSFFEGEKNSSECTLYQHSTHPVTDQWNNTLQQFSFVPLEKAHTLSFKQTKNIASFLHKNFENKKTFLSIFQYAIPLKRLSGISTPALLIEWKLHKNDTWYQYADGLIEAIKSAKAEGIFQ